jgi:hypothetical protein
MRGIGAENSEMSTRPDNVSLFQVPLQCPAAPQIGCGSRAKPILLALESDPGISEAWLNDAGTSLAVVGEGNSSREARARTVETQLVGVFGKSATELQGEARDRELKSFLSGSDWYRGTQVDSLSRREAGIIAVRLLRRVQARVIVSGETARAFEIALTEAFKRHIIREPGQPASAETSRHDDLLTVAREHLDEKGLAAFRQSLANGYRPGPNEE